MITFGANFRVNNNVYDRLASPEERDAVAKTVSEYEKFVNHPKIEALTEGDTIELKRAKHRGGYALELEITSPKLDEPYITGVYTNKKEPTISHRDLMHQTYLYICHRLGEKPRFFESSFGFIDRVLFDGKLRQARKEK